MWCNTLVTEREWINFSNKIELRVDSMLRKAAEEVVVESKQSMPLAPIQLTKKSFRYIPSLPGRPPHRRTGNLARSINYRRVASKNYIIKTDVKYGLFLEIGTRYMAPRPFLRPAILKVGRKFSMLFKNVNFGWTRI